MKLELTGAAKQAFDAWFEVNIEYTVPCSNHGCKDADSEDFDDLPNAMKFGVFQLWADSVGYLLTVTIIDDFSDWTFDVMVEDFMGGFFSLTDEIEEFKTREEAQAACIKKLDELFNNNEQ